MREIDRDRIGDRPIRTDALAVFSVLWALASIWHLLGNPLLAPDWAQAVLVVAAAVVLLRPGAVVPLGGLAAAQLVTVWLEAPQLGNHWLLVGLVDVAIVLAVGVAVVRRRLTDRIDLTDRLFPAARLCLLGFYGFAAFAKLNEAFFDRSVSCAVFYFDEATSSVGFDWLQFGGSAWVDRAVIAGTAGVELAIPVLLALRRTRHLGVVVGIAFHGLVAVDRAHQFFDFSSVLFALFVLFLPPSSGTWVAERLGSARARLALRHDLLPVVAHLLVVAGVVLAGLGVAFDRTTPDEALDSGWWPWQGFALVTLVAVVLYLRQERPVPHSRLVPHHALFLLAPLLVVVNGLTPYLELKTGYGWNMYANLRTVDGESNHLLVRSTLPLTDEQEDIVRIVATDDPVLEAYRVARYGLTWRQFGRYLADNPDISVTFERGGEVTELDRAADLRAGDGAEPLPAWREKLQLFRAVDLTEPERCVPGFGPAR